MQIDSIFTQLPNEIQTILGKEDPNNWITLLNNKQKETKQDGEYLATLLLFLAKHDTVDVKKRDMVCRLLKIKEQNNELSSMARTAYCTAKIYIEKLRGSSVNCKCAATETVKGQLPKKQQTRGMVRAQVIEQQTCLPKPLPDLINQYEEGMPFPGVRGTFNLQYDFFNPDFFELRAKLNRSGEGSMLMLTCATPDALLKSLTIDHQPKHKHKFSFSCSINEAEIKSVQKYFEDNSLPVEPHYFLSSHYFVIYTKQNALFIVNLLADSYTFPDGLIKKLQDIITTYFDE